ncbi:GNAT family N-acetyltransferase [Brevibacillus migulae]|uniref:GNAT family N-acetyltransferase n=1 Tax=Brevibacillus migulae TaxID=1644114 RepID=UPI00106E906B|nr:GNAT family N-acetyltransferase [Brevibacillus migulae]
MSAHFRPCLTDDDYVQFTRFFIENRLDFSQSFSLNDTLLHILQTLQDSRIILVVSNQDQVVGWGHYQYLGADEEPDSQGEIAFINSVILAKAYRRHSLLFLRGLRYLTKQIYKENPAVKQVRFHALSENAYLNRLYAKFTRVIGEREGDHGHEHIYATSLEELMAYLSISKDVR